ncbi:hypothetical protein T02_2589 [Trichinella nativa]|uniref:Uncharacterized protein n=1 Tax=Trichinella nativa TaxID=6335 RepID=A0A0V1LBZ1_9BILA|nr:hypothetical protein T02_2589 [Trichinella nativa]
MACKVAGASYSTFSHPLLPTFRPCLLFMTNQPASQINNTFMQALSLNSKYQMQTYNAASCLHKFDSSLFMRAKLTSVFLSFAMTCTSFLTV